MEKTVKNLGAAFIGESQARNRYTIYSKVAKDEGYEQISSLFAITADNEKQHAKWLMKMLQELKAQGADVSNIHLDAEVPTVWGKTTDNLKAAIGGENYEHSEMYPNFAADAEAEGLPAVADRLRAIAKAEAHHEGRYIKLLVAIEDGSIFRKGEKTMWLCRECGYVHYSETPPEKCPSCDHPKAFFQLQSESF